MSCVKCLKFFVNLSAIVFLILAIIQVSCGGYQLNKDTDIWDYAGWDFNSSYGWGMIIGGLLLFFIAIAGFVGAKKQSAFCLAIFNLGMIVLFLMFGIIYLVAKGTRDTFLDELEDSGACANVDFMTSSAKLVTAGKATFGGSVDCTMWIERPNDWPMGTFTGKEHTTSDAHGYSNVQDCKIWDGEDEDATKFVKLLEEQFQCSGICDEELYFIFSDINDGQPKDSCQDALGDFVKKYAQLVEWITGITTLWLLFTILAGCALCCAHKKEPENIGQSYYAMQHGAYSYK